MHACACAEHLTQYKSEDEMHLKDNIMRIRIKNIDQTNKNTYQYLFSTVDMFMVNILEISNLVLVS